MSPAVALAVLRQTSCRGPLLELAHGFSTTVLVSADNMVIRVPRDAESGRRLEREVLTLQRLRPQLRTAIPGPATWWPAEGPNRFGFLTYPRVAGQVPDGDAFSSTISEWLPDLVAVWEDLRAVHGGLGGRRVGDGSAWVQDELRRASRLEPRLAAFLTAGERHRWRRWFATESRIYDRVPWVHVSLAHKDLWWGNLLFTEAHRLSGVLDWEWAGPDDPAVDLAGLREAGPDLVDAVIPAFVELYPEPISRLRRKVDVMWALRALQGLEWAFRHGDTPEWEEGLGKLRAGPILA